MATNMRDISFATFNLHNLQVPGAPMYPQSDPIRDEEFARQGGLGGGHAAAARRRRHRLPGGLVAGGAGGGASRATELGPSHRLAFITDGAWDGVAVACAVRAPWEIRAVERHKAFPDGDAAREAQAVDGADPLGAAGRGREVDPERDPEFVPSQEDEGVRVEIDEFARSVLQVTVGHARARRKCRRSRCSART